LVWDSCIQVQLLTVSRNVCIDITQISCNSVNVSVNNYKIEVPIDEILSPNYTKTLNYDSGTFSCQAVGNIRNSSGTPVEFMGCLTFSITCSKINIASGNFGCYHFVNSDCTVVTLQPNTTTPINNTEIVNYPFVTKLNIIVFIVYYTSIVVGILIVVIYYFTKSKFKSTDPNTNVQFKVLQTIQD